MSKVISLSNLSRFKDKCDIAYLNVKTLSGSDTLNSLIGKGKVFIYNNEYYIGRVYGTQGVCSFEFESCINVDRYVGSSVSASLTVADVFNSTYYKPLATESYVDTAVSQAITGVYKIQGSDNPTNLNNKNKTAAMDGYVYNILVGGNLNNSDSEVVPGAQTATSIGDNVVFIWNSGHWWWDKLGATVDTSAFVPNTRTVAGNTLSSDISAQTLTDSLIVASNTDIDNLF